MSTMTSRVELPPGHAIRPMRAEDLPAVHALEIASQTAPWTLAQFETELTTRVATLDVYWVADRLAGFLCSWLVAGELQVQNLATAPAFRRQGVAHQLLQHVLLRGAARGMDSAWLEVRVSNRAAIRLYESFGFRQAGHRRAYYADGEDALIMSYRVADPEEVRSAQEK